MATKTKNKKKESKQQQLDDIIDTNGDDNIQKIVTLINYRDKRDAGHAFEARFDQEKLAKTLYIFVDDKLKVHHDYLMTIELVKEDDNNIAYKALDYTLLNDNHGEEVEEEDNTPVTNEPSEEEINQLIEQQNEDKVEYIKTSESRKPDTAIATIDDNTRIETIKGERITYQQNSPALRSEDLPLSITPEDVKSYIGDHMKVKPTDAEIKLFVQFCLSNRLDPFQKDAYLIKYNKDSQASFQVSRDLYLKRADEHEDYKGYEAGIIVFNPQTKQIEEREGAFYMPRQGERLLGAYAIVYRQGMVPFKAKVSLDEYNQNRSLWNSKPATMIVKVAIAQALRGAFPNALSGLYFDGEMDQQ